MIGQRLEHIRGSRTQGEMAEQLGVHKNTYSRWEREEREIGAEALARIVQAGWNANWLLTGQGPEHQSSGTPQIAEPQGPYLDPAALAHATSILLGVLAEDSTDLAHADFGAALLDIYTAMRTGGSQALTQAITTAAAKAKKQNG